MSESIYNLIPEEECELKEYRASEALRKSKQRAKNEITILGSTFGCRGSSRIIGAGGFQKKPGSLYGIPNPKYIKTSQSLQNTKLNKQSGLFSYNDARKPNVPKIDEKPVLGIRSNKNFIVTNAVEAIVQVPKRIENTEIDYTKKEDYGKVPEYLNKVKEEIQREKEMIERYVKTKMNAYTSNQKDDEFELPEYERLELIDSLKQKWEVVNARYQRISHHVILETDAQVKRKADLENELDQLERSIEKLEKHQVIVIK